LDFSALTRSLPHLAASVDLYRGSGATGTVAFT
jgi:hypothetical protein